MITTVGWSDAAAMRIARSITSALELSPRRQQRHIRLMRDQIAHQNVYRWAGRLLTAMLRVEQLDDDDI